MGRTVRLSEFGSGDRLSPVGILALEDQRLRQCVRSLKLAGGTGRVDCRYGGLVAALTIFGTVPEIPNIEDLEDTGWVFRQVWNLGTKAPIISFDIPEGSERHLDRLLMFYIMLYGDLR